MNASHALALSAPLSALLLAGCANAPKDAGFSDVVDATRDRTGYSLAWTRGAAEDAKVNDVTAALLDGDLTLSRAVQVSLLNNRGLQATFEDLGIARGQLIDAGIIANPVFSMDLWAYGGGTVFEGLLSEDLTSILYQPLRVGVRRGELEAAKLRVTAQVVALVGDLKRGYFQYQADKQLVEMLRQVVQATEASYSVATRMREAGGIRQLDVLQERALFEQAKVDLNAAIEHLSQSREMPNSLMGLWGNQLSWNTPARLPDLPAGEAAPRASTESYPTEAVTSAEYPSMFPPVDRKVRPAGIPQGEKPRPMMMAGMPPKPPTAEGRAEGLAGPPSNSELSDQALAVLGRDEIASPAAPTSRPSAGRFADVERAAVSRNLDLAAQRSFITAQAYRLKLDVATAVVPFANVGLDGQKERNQTDWGVGPGGAVKIPIFNWGQGVYPREASRLRKRVGEYAFLATNIRAAAVTAEAQLQYNAMQIGQFDLLLNKRLQIQAGLLYVAALRDYWTARADLEQILDGSVPTGGMLPAADLTGTLAPSGVGGAGMNGMGANLMGGG